MQKLYRDGDQERVVEVVKTDQGYEVRVDGIVLDLTVVRRGDALELTSRATGGAPARVWVSREGNLRWVTAPGLGDAVLEQVARRRRGDDPKGDLSSPMPGKVVRIAVEKGQLVARGDTVVVVEAMKTELAITAPRAGRVAKINVTLGALCEAMTPLIDLEPDKDAKP